MQLINNLARIKWSRIRISRGQYLLRDDGQVPFRPRNVRPHMGLTTYKIWGIYPNTPLYVFLVELERNVGTIMSNRFFLRR